MRVLIKAGHSICDSSIRGVDSNMNSLRALATRCYANAYLLLSVTTFFWAGNAVAGKIVAGLVTPVTMTFLRWTLAALLVLLLARKHLRRDMSALMRQWPLVFGLGALGFSAFNLLLYSALNYTTAINVTIEQSAMPVTIMLVNFIAFRQRIRALQCVGVVATIVGVVVTASHGDPWLVIAQGMNVGDALMLGTVLLYSGYTVALRYKPAVHGLSLMAGMCVSAWLFTSPFFAYEVIEKGFEWPVATAWGAIIFAATGPAIVSQLFFMRGVELIGSNRAGVFINLVPIFGAVLAVLILNEDFQAFHLLALVLVLGGIAVAERFAPPN
ncbi:MAG: drug/metabolite transporter (DMT)-like permease [Gammaproteobacteria bacterium]